jgi:hypothetical protein
MSTVSDMRNEQRRLHPEHIEAHEVALDLVTPNHVPVISLHREGPDPRRVVAIIPDSERHKLYIGRLVRIEIANGDARKGSIEAIDGHFATVRYVDWAA